MPLVRPAAWAALVAASIVIPAAAQPPAQPSPLPPAVPPAAPAAPPAAPGQTTQPPQPDPKMAPQPKAPEWPKEIGGRPMAEWLKDLTDPDPTVRDTAVKTLPAFGPDVRKPAAKPLIALINDPDPTVRINALIVITAMGFDTPEHEKEAADKLNLMIPNTTRGSIIRLHGARALASLGPEGVTGLPSLMTLADDYSYETRHAAAVAMAQVGGAVYPPAPAAPPPADAKPPAPKRPASKAAMDKLMFTMLKDTSYAVRMEAAQSLIKLGPPYAPETDPEAYLKAVRPYNEGVISRLKAEKDDRVKIWLLVLTLMYDDKQTESAVSKIAAYLKVENPPVQVNALQALSLLGTNAKPALTPIRETLRVHDQLVSAAAVTCLMALGATAKPAIADLEQLQTAAKDEELKKAYGRAITVIRSAVDASPQPAKKDPPKK